MKTGSYRVQPKKSVSHVRLYVYERVCIHPFPSAYPGFRIAVELKVVSLWLDWQNETITHAHVHTCQFRLWESQWGHAQAGRTCKLQSASGSKHRIFLLCGDSANHCTSTNIGFLRLKLIFTDLKIQCMGQYFLSFRHTKCPHISQTFFIWQNVTMQVKHELVLFPNQDAD